MSKPLPTEITASAFRDHLSAYLDAAERGQTITRRGRPSLRLTTAEEPPAALDLDDLRAFRESLDVRVEGSVVASARQDERD